MPLERDKANGFKLSYNAEMNTGMWPENFGDKVPLWSFGRNIVFTPQGLKKSGGNTQIISTGVGDPIRGIVQIQEGPDGIAYIGDLTQLYRVNMSESTFTVEGTGYTLDRDDASSLWDGGTSIWDGGTSLWDQGLISAGQWSMVSYGAFILATNGGDFPQINRQDLNGFVPMIGLGPVTTIEIFVNRGPHVLGFNTNISDKEFIWCDADNVDDWEADVDNLAGQLEIRELKSRIRAAVPLGGRIAVYGDDQMFVVNYLANDLVFGYQPAQDGIGAVAKNSVVPVGRLNYGLGQQGFWVTDGAQSEYIDDPQVRAWWRKNSTEGQLGKVTGYHDEDNHLVRWYFPELDSVNTTSITYDYKTRVWSFIDGDRSATDSRTIMGFAPTGSETGQLLAEDIGDNDNTAAITAFARTKSISFDNADLVKELDSIRIAYQGNNLQYRVGWSETADGTINWEPYAPVPDGFDFSNLRTAGRWLHVELYSDELNTAWEAVSMQVIGRFEGTR